MPHHVLLSVGSDPDLMTTRSMVLRQAGYAVETAMTVRTAMPLFVSGDFDLVIICASIPEGQRIQLISAIKSKRPLAMIMIDDVVPILDRGKALLESVANNLAPGDY
jgi:DNA-binding response OmpR family regulator